MVPPNASTGRERGEEGAAGRDVRGAVLGFSFPVDFVIFAIVHSTHHAYAGG
jgi:hypothetical protein